MNNRIYLLIHILTHSNLMMKVAIKIEEEDNPFKIDEDGNYDYMYYRESDVLAKFKKLFPKHIESGTKCILAVEEIYEII